MPRAVEKEDTQFIEKALQEYEAQLVGYAMNILNDLEQARDVVQDTFLKLYHQDREKVKDKLKSWLFTVCRNRAIDVLRKEKRMIQVEGEALDQLKGSTPTPLEIAQKKEHYTEALQELENLPKNQGEVIYLKFYHGLSYKEISEITDLSESNVGFLIHTGLKTLRKKLKKKQAP